MTQPRRYQDALPRRITSRRCGHVAGVDLLVLTASSSRLLVLRTSHRATSDYSHPVLRNASRLPVLRAALIVHAPAYRIGADSRVPAFPQHWVPSIVDAALHPRIHMFPGAASMQATMGHLLFVARGVRSRPLHGVRGVRAPRRLRLVSAPEGHGCSRSSELLHRCAVRGAQRLRAACSRFAHRNAERPAARIAEQRNGHAKRERDARDAGSGSRSEPLTCGARCAARSASSEGSA